jgi:hypothetical protein
MIRKLILAVAVLAMTAVPMSALARDAHREFDGRHEFERREQRPFFFGVYPEPNSAYAPRCYWQPGYWANQPYVDANGDYAYVSQWVPPQQVCY